MTMHTAEREWSASRAEREASGVIARGLRAWWHSRSRPIPIVVAAATCIATRHSAALDRAAASPEASVAEAFVARGLVCDAADVVWVDAPRGLRSALLGAVSYTHLTLPTILLV